MKQAKSHIYASVGTLLALLLLLLLLFTLTISAPKVEEDEGIVVSFGNADEGGGRPDAPTISEEMPQPKMTPAPAVAQRPSNNDLMVQEDNSLALAKQREEEAKKRAEAEELIRRQKQAEAQAEAERKEHERLLAEERARQQEAIDKASKMGALFGQANSDQGANADNYTGKASASAKGNPIGRGFGGPKGGPTWTLAGRDCKALPKPSADFKQQGNVVVNIQVDIEGNVTKVSVGSGTTVSDKYTQQLALEAARKAKFTKGDVVQQGSIIYTFKLN